MTTPPRPSMLPAALTTIALAPGSTTETVDRAARAAGVAVRHLGLAPLWFDTARLYHGTHHDWIIAPAALDPHAPTYPIPPRPRRDLKRLHRHGLDPLIYLAHELAPHPATTTSPAASSTSTSPAASRWAAIAPAHASTLIGPAPTPRRTARAAHAATTTATTTRSLWGRAGHTLAAAAAATTVILDPIVLGAFPLQHPGPGSPAAWFTLTQWDW